MDQYLNNYSEPEVTALDGLLLTLPAEPWENVLVVPACNESARFLRRPPRCDGRSLMILVINETESASESVSESNLALATAIRSQFESRSKARGEVSGSGPGFELELLSDPRDTRDVLLVDRFSEGRKLPVKGGVGHARKIGADLAASLHRSERIRSPWIHCSDADVDLPDTYFSCIDSRQYKGLEYAALVYPYRHSDSRGTASQEVLLATQLYECSLRYYVAGLQFASSPYAFHTIGSTMAINAHHYAKVRGFPRREAGEDFYLLNKLAKVGSVVELEASERCQPIEIESRRSDRVPFGTGAAVNRIVGTGDPLRHSLFYNPAVFELLKAWLQSWPEIWHSHSSDLNPILLNERTRGLACAENLELLLAGLDRMKAAEAVDHAFRQSRDFKQFSRQMHTWFDAFRTLKLIHFLRDHALPSVNYAEIESVPFYPGWKPIP